MKRIVARVAMLSLLGGLFFAVAGRAPAEEELSVRLYNKNVRSAVIIHTVVTLKTKEGTAREISSSGSGSLIDAKRRLILTNWHVVDELKAVRVDFPLFVKKGKDEVMVRATPVYESRAKKGEALLGKVLARDKSRDLAVVQVDHLPPGATAIPLARKSTEVGETVWNIGSPTTGPDSDTLVFSITEGKVRAVGEREFVVGQIGVDAFKVKAKFVTASNPINPGDSGGPLFDKRGYQVAVSQSGRGGVQQVNGFIDVEEVRAFLRDNNLEVEELTPPEPGTGVVVEPKKGTGPAPKKELTPGVASEADEKAAAAALRAAKSFGESEDGRALYLRRLEELIKKYPATAAAKEAKKLLGK